MKLQFTAIGQTAPDSYNIDDEKVNGINLSIIEHGGKFVGNEKTQAAGLRGAERDENGELWVTLCQEVGSGHWRRSNWIDLKDYDPAKIYVTKLDKPYAGKAWAKNGKGEKVYG